MNPGNNIEYYYPFLKARNRDRAYKNKWLNIHGEYDNFCKQAYAEWVLMNLYWYDRALMGFFKKIGFGNYREIESVTGISWQSCYSRIKKIMARIELGPDIKKRDLPMKRASYKNENLMRDFAKKAGVHIPADIKTITKKGRGRPKNIGISEKKYTAILKTDDIADMKTIASKKGLNIKDAYAEAIEDYKKKYQNLLHQPTIEPTVKNKKA